MSEVGQCTVMITRSRNNSNLRAESSWFLTAIEIPVNFEPQVIQSGRIYGLNFMESIAQVVCCG